MTRIGASVAAVLLVLAQPVSGATPSAETADFVDRMLPALPMARVLPRAPLASHANSVFNKFLSDSSAMRYEDFAKIQPSATAEVFQSAQRYMGNLFNGMRVSASVQIGDITFDCIPIHQQPSLRDGAPLDEPPSVSLRGTTGQSILGYPDKNCPTGTIPLKRPSVASLTRFGTLRNYFSKDRGLGAREGAAYQQILKPLAADSGSLTSDGHIHRYAVIREQAEVTGLYSRLNVWNPVIPPREMSLSQTWIASEQQTLESGWQVGDEIDPAHAAPFIYSTQDGYNVTGCYDLDCAGFVQTTPQVIFAPFAPSRYSSAGGMQQVLDVEWHRNPKTGNWWLALNGNWAGYYPAKLFSTGPLGSGPQKINVIFGGENTGSRPQAQMGSGEFSGSGYAKAAYQSDLVFWDLAGQRHDVTGSEYVTNPKCYSLTGASIAGPPGAAGSFFYFGGPGILDQACAQAEGP